MIDPLAAIIIAIGLPLAMIGFALIRWSLVRKTYYNDFVSRRASVFNVQTPDADSFRKAGL